MTSDFVGINNNLGDTAAISDICGGNKRDMCEVYLGIDGSAGGDVLHIATVFRHETQL